MFIRNWAIRELERHRNSYRATITGRPSLILVKFLQSQSNGKWKAEIPKTTETEAWYTKWVSLWFKSRLSLMKELVGQERDLSLIIIILSLSSLLLLLFLHDSLMEDWPTLDTLHIHLPGIRTYFLYWLFNFCLIRWLAWRRSETKEEFHLRQGKQFGVEEWDLTFYLIESHLAWWKESHSWLELENSPSSSNSRIDLDCRFRLLYFLDSYQIYHRASSLIASKQMS